MSKLVLLVILLSAVLQCALCIKFHILLSLNSQCPGELAGDPCLTLQQYVSYPSQSPNITLEFEPGSHKLTSSFQVSGGMYFGLIAPANATIECSGLSSVQVTFSSVTNVDIKGMTFLRCGQVYIQSSTNGSVARSNFIDTRGSYSLRISSSSVMVNYCTFANNTRGRSIYLYSSSAVITQSNFRNNTGHSGAAIYSIYPLTYLTIEECTFAINTVIYYGAAVYVPNSYGSSIISIRNNIYEDNRASSYGGAIYVAGSTNTRVNITGNTFINNTSGNYGGAVYLTGSNTVTSHGNSFTSNTAYYGGALYVSGTSVDSNNRYTDNRANYGGALYVSGSITSRGSNYSNNIANNDGGALYISDSYNSLSVNGSTFLNNRARQGRGGAIYAPHSRLSVNIHDSTFVNNVGFSGGGAICMLGSQPLLIVNGTTFVNNLITGPNGNGGAVNVAYTNARQIEFNNNIFINNSALNGSGGAVYTKQGITITDSIFGQNRAPLCAAFNVEPSYRDHSISLSTTTFLRNTAIGFTVRGNLGGVGCIRNTEISIQFCTFSHNSAAGGGGVLDSEDSIVNIESSTFKNNTAGVDGGVFYTHAFPSNYMINESRFVNNRAGDDGGVLYLGRSGSSAEINRNSFTDNVATDRGGTVALFGSTVNVTDTNFQNNMANKGSAISACNSNGANIIPLNVQTDLTFPVCRLYDGSIQRYPEPQTHDNSNFDITAYFQRFMHGEEPSLPPPTIEFSSTTDTEVDPILLDIQSRLFGTSVITYLLFAFAVIFAVIVIVVIAVKFKRILKKRKMKKLPPDTANEENESIELYEEPDWSIQREANPKQMEQNNRYNMQKRYVKK